LINSLIFFTFATIAVIMGIITIFARNPINSAMALITCLISLSPIFLQLDAHFIAIIQILVYAGAIMVLFIFIIMLMNPKEENLPPNEMNFLKLKGMSLGVILFSFLIVIIMSYTSNPSISLYAEFGKIKEFGKLFTGKYLFLFEAVSILLTVSLLSVVTLINKEAE